MRVALFHTDTDPWALGIRGISSVLRKAGHQTRIIVGGQHGESYSHSTLQAAEALVADCELIGVSCLSKGSDRAAQLVDHLLPLRKPIVWGGLHATLNPEECIQHANVVCRGEGEETILEVIEQLESEGDIKNIQNTVWKSNGRVEAHPLRRPIADLDRLPPHDFSCTDEYHLSTRGFIRLSHASQISPTGEVVTIGSRGCAFHCTYCCNAAIKKLYAGNGRYVRRMSVSRYIEHLQLLLKNCFPQARYFFLADEDFFSRPIDEIREFSEEYPMHVGIPFECCGSPPQIEAEKMDLLVKAGLWRIRMGIESGSERTKREVYRRPISNETVLRAAEIISKYPQVVPYYFFIMTNPYEENQDLVQTFDLMKRLARPYYAQAFNLVLFPGSELYERAVSDGMIHGRDDCGYELDFRGGLRYTGYSWKQKNLYLNGLLYFMEGRSTRLRQGIIPRPLLPVLLHPAVVAFVDKHPALTRVAIRMNTARLKIRAFGAAMLKRLTKNPTHVYNLWRSVRKTLTGGPCSA